jgi:predicted Rossmann fold nucleotide-binding protein DprA/Smf involved in DNA uptake
MKLVYENALQKLNGFDALSIEIAENLAENDVVETIGEFVDFINFNIEEGKFPHISKPFNEKYLRDAVAEAQKEVYNIVQSVDVDNTMYPKRLLRSEIDSPSRLFYKGNLNNLKRRSIMITGSYEVSRNAEYAAKFYGNLFASNGYNMLTTLASGCEKSSMSGCSKAKGNCTFFLPHSLKHLSLGETNAIKKGQDDGRTTALSVSREAKCNTSSIQEAYRYVAALADCLIVPQLSFHDDVFNFIRSFFNTPKPVYFIQYKNTNNEYDCKTYLEPLGLQYLISDTALETVQNAIGKAK